MLPPLAWLLQGTIDFYGVDTANASTATAPLKLNTYTFQKK